MLQPLRHRACQSLGKTRFRHIHDIAARKYDQDHDPAREDQSFQLQDGRTMGFAEYGDFKGTPVFCLHGSPGSRYDGMGFVDVAKKLKVRIICPDRPGFGLSTLDQSRKLSEYARDISALAKHLAIPKYHVFGGSGGGPFAVACAHSSPRDELLNAAVVAGMGPPGILNIRDAGWYTVLALGTAKWVPGLMRTAMNWGAKVSDENMEKQLKFILKLLSKEDREYLKKPEIEALLMKTLKGAYEQGPGGAIRDAQIYGSAWDFKLKDVRRRVKLFFGGKDTRTPLAFGRYYKQHLPKAELYEYNDASHITISKYDEEMLKNIVGDVEPEKASRVYK